MANRGLRTNNLERRLGEFCELNHSKGEVHNKSVRKTGATVTCAGWPKKQKVVRLVIWYKKKGGTIPLAYPTHSTHYFFPP